MTSSFSTDHLLADLKGRTVSSTAVTISAQGAQLVITFVSVIVLARLLSPRDFGLVAMAMTVVGFLRPLGDGGLSTATLQCEAITHAQVSNLFWTNLALGAVLSGLTALSAPVVGWLYREPVLVPLTLALCAAPLLTSSTVQHLALLRRQMRFGSIAVIQVTSMVGGVLLGIVLAYRGFGYWSLVGTQLATPAIVLAETWWISDWRPQAPRTGVGTRSLLNFGAVLTVSGTLWAVARGCDTLLIGRFCGSEALGLYNRAAALLHRPLEQVVSPVAAVTVPVLSRVQSQAERYRRVVLRLYDAAAVSTFLFTGLLLALSRPITLFVLGPKWVEAAPIFAAFTLVALYTPVASVASWVMTSQGRAKDFLIQSTVSSVLVVVSFSIGVIWGPIGVALSYSLFCLLAALPITYHLAGRRGPVTSGDLWTRFVAHLPLWLVVCGTAWGTNQLVAEPSPLAQLLIGGGAGLAAGLVFVAAYAPARRAAKDVWGLVAEFRR